MAETISTESTKCQDSLEYTCNSNKSSQCNNHEGNGPAGLSYTTRAVNHIQNAPWDRNEESDSGSDTNLRSQTEQDTSKTTLPLDCLSSVSMPKNWHQVVKLKEQRRLLQQNLSNKTHTLCNLDDCENNLKQNETEGDQNDPSDATGVTVMELFQSPPFNFEDRLESEDGSQASQEYSPIQFTDTDDDSELRSLSAEKLNTYLTDAASLSQELQVNENSYEANDSFTTHTNGDFNNNSYSNYTESICKWSYGYSKNKNKYYVVPKISKSESQLCKQRVPRSSNKSRSETSISHLKTFPSKEKDDHVFETENSDSNFPACISFDTEDKIIDKKITKQRTSEYPYTGGLKQPPKACITMNRTCDSEHTNDIIKQDTDLSEGKDIELLRSRVKEVQEGVVDNLEKVVGNITSGSMYKRLGNENDTTNSEKQTLLNKMDSENRPSVLQEVPPEPETKDKYNSINHKVPTSVANNEMAQQIELYELKKKITEQKMKILDMQIEQLDLLKTNSKSDINILSLKKEINSKSLEINKKQLQLMHDNSKIIEMVSKVKEKCSEQKPCEVQQSHTLNENNNNRIHTDGLNRVHLLEIVQQNNKCKSPLPSQISTTNTADHKTTNNEAEHKVLTALQKPDNTQATLNTGTYENNFEENITNKITIQTCKTLDRNIKQDQPDIMSPLSQVLCNLKPATLAALNVGKKTTIPQVSKTPQDISVVLTTATGSLITNLKGQYIHGAMSNIACSHTSNMYTNTSTTEHISQSMAQNQGNEETFDILSNTAHTSQNTDNSSKQCGKQLQRKQPSIRRILPKLVTQAAPSKPVKQPVTPIDSPNSFTTLNRTPSFNLTQGIPVLRKPVNICNEYTAEQLGSIVQPMIPPAVIYMDKFGNVVYDPSYRLQKNQNSIVSSNIVSIPIQTKLPVVAPTFVTSSCTPYSDILAKLAKSGNTISVTVNSTIPAAKHQQPITNMHNHLTNDVEICSPLPETDIFCKQSGMALNVSQKHQSQCTDTKSIDGCNNAERHTAYLRSVPEKIPQVRLYDMQNGKVSPTKATVSYGSDHSTPKRNRHHNDNCNSLEPQAKQRKITVTGTPNVVPITESKSQSTEKNASVHSCKATNDNQWLDLYINSQQRDNSKCKTNKKKRKKAKKRKLVRPVPFLDFPARIVQNTAKIIVSPQSKANLAHEMDSESLEVKSHTVSKIPSASIQSSMEFEEENPLKYIEQCTTISTQNSYLNDNSISEKNNSENSKSIASPSETNEKTCEMDSGMDTLANGTSVITETNTKITSSTKDCTTGTTGATSVITTHSELCPLAVSVTETANGQSSECLSGTAMLEKKASGKLILLKGDTSSRWDHVKKHSGNGRLSDTAFVQHLLKQEEIRQFQIKHYNAMLNFSSLCSKETPTDQDSKEANIIPRKITPTKQSHHRARNCTPETVSEQHSTSGSLHKSTSTQESLDDSYGRLVIDETDTEENIYEAVYDWY